MKKTRINYKISSKILFYYIADLPFQNLKFRTFKKKLWMKQEIKVVVSKIRFLWQKFLQDFKTWKNVTSFVSWKKNHYFLFKKIFNLREIILLIMFFVMEILTLLFPILKIKIKSSNIVISFKKIFLTKNSFNDFCYWKLNFHNCKR